ncbi:MAG: tetratricopeptide repeat protein [Deltaproteobacteria bacterium]|nr:tetratricopeptide repeat protein [Deltaproteobacteria bacterium]
MRATFRLILFVFALVFAHDALAQPRPVSSKREQVRPAALPSPVLAPKPPSVVPLESVESIVEPYRELESLWRTFRAPPSAGAAKGGAPLTLDSIKNFAVRHSIRNLFPYAAVLIRDAERMRADDAGGGGDTKARNEASLKAARGAVELAPDLPEAHLAVADAILADNMWAWASAIESAVRAVKILVTDPERKKTLFGNLLIFGLLALAATVLSFLLLQIVKHIRFVVHDLNHVLALGSIATVFVLLFLLFLPILFGVGAVGVLFVALLILWPYQGNSERIGSLFSVAGVFGLVLGLEALASLLVLNDPILTDLQTLNAGLPSAETVRRIKARVERAAGEGSGEVMGANGAGGPGTSSSRSQGEFEPIFVLALRYKVAHRFDAAEALFKRAETIDSNDGAVQVNLGNIAFERGLRTIEREVDPAKRSPQMIKEALAEARGRYEKAIQWNPRIASAHYNLSRLRYAAGELEAAPAAETSAREIDSALVDLFVRLEALDGSAFEERLLAGGASGASSGALRRRLLMDEVLSPERVYRFAYRETVARSVLDGTTPRRVVDLLRRQMWGQVSEVIPADLVGPIAGGVGLLLLLLAVFIRRGNIAHACGKCGHASCNRCHITLRRREICAQCFAMFESSGPIDPRLRIQKELEIRRYQRRRINVERVLAAIFMGSGHVLRGQAIRGFVFLLFFWFILFQVLIWGDILKPIQPVEAAMSVVRIVLLGVVFVLAYVTSVVDFWRR